MAMSEVRNGFSENADGTRTPYFQHFWKPGSGYYGESLGRFNKGATDICEDLVLSHIGKFVIFLVFLTIIFSYLCSSFLEMIKEHDTSLHA